MTSGHEHSYDPDAELPADLTRAQADLTAYISARVRPGAALLKILDASSGEGSATADVSADPPYPAGGECALAIIRTRVRARALDRALAADLALDHDLGIALGHIGTIISAVDRALDRERPRARDLARPFVRASALAATLELARRRGGSSDLIRVRFLAEDLDRALDSACVLDPSLGRALDPDLTLAQDLVRARPLAPGSGSDLADARKRAFALVRALTAGRDRDGARERKLAFARDLARDLGRDLAQDRAPDRARVLDRARDRCREVLREVAAVPVDVSGCDLSGEDLADLDVLLDAIWTPETTKLPPGVKERLIERSQEIRPGVYQVREHGHGEREPVSQLTP